MRKKQLLADLQCARARIAVLEGILCPLQRHAWEYDHLDECYICKRCGKVRWVDYEEG